MYMKATKLQQKQLIALLALVLLGLSGLFIGFQALPPSSENTYSNTFEITPITTPTKTIPLTSPGQAQEQVGLIDKPITQRMNQPLYDYYTTGIIPDVARTYNGKLGVMLTALNTINLDEVRQYMDIMWTVNLGPFTIITGTIDNNMAIENLFSLDGAVYMSADYFTRPEYAQYFNQINKLSPDIAFEKIAKGEIALPRYEKGLGSLELMASDSGIAPNQGLAVGYMNGDVYSDTYNGSGVTIGIVDTGTDFGNSDLSKALALDNGFPLTIDPGSDGIALTGLVFNDADGDGIGELNTTASLDFSDYGVYISGAGFAASLQAFLDFYGLTFPDTYGLPTVTSQSGNYLFGVAAQSVGGVVPYQLAFFVLVDSTTPGTYDTLFIDFDTSAYINWKAAGLEALAIDLNAVPDFSFADEMPYTWQASTNPEDFVLARDFNNDGTNDFSLGSLSMVLDPFGVTEINENMTGSFTEGVFGSYIINGIDPNGLAFGYMFDNDGHGTWTASAAGARGLVNYTVEYVDFEGSLPWRVIGTAPGAEIGAAKFFSNFDLFASYLYLAGFDVSYNATSGEASWTLSTTRAGADILSNSWGYSSELAGGQLTGFNFDSFFIDLLSLPGVADPSYDGVLFVFSQGNDGNGFGNSPAPEPFLALKVGASTTMSYRQLASTWAGGRDGHLVDFSSAGPDDIGVSTPDVLAPGAYAYSASPLWFQTLLNDMYPDGNTSVDLWGGTSLSAPFAAGAAAVAWQTFAKAGAVDPLTVRLAVINTASNRGLSPSLQGTGIINISNLVDTILDVTGDANAPTGDRFLAYNNDSIALAHSVTSVWFSLLFGSANLYQKYYTFGYPTEVYPDNFNVSLADFSNLKAGNIYAGILSPGESYQTNVTLDGDTTGVTASAMYAKRTKTITLDMPISAESTHVYYNLSEILTGQDWTDFQNADAAFMQIIDPTGAFTSFGLFFVRLYDWIDSNNNNTIDDEELYFVQQNLDDAGDTGHVGMYLSDPGSIFQGTPVLWIYAGVIVDGENLTLKIDLFNYNTWNNVEVNSLGAGTYNVTVTAPSAPGYYEGYVKFASSTGYEVYMPVSFMVEDVLDSYDTPLTLASTTEANDALFSHNTARIDGGDGSRLSFPFVATYNLTANNKADAVFHIMLTQDDPYDYYAIGFAETVTGSILYIYDGGATTSDGLVTHYYVSYDMGYFLVFVQALSLNGGTGSFNLTVSIEDPVPLDPVTIDFETGDFYSQIRGVDAKLRTNFTGRAEIENRGLAINDFLFVINAPTPPVRVDGVFATDPTPDTSIDEWVSFDFSAGDIVTWTGGDPDGIIDFDIFVFDPTSGVDPTTYPVGSDVPFSAAIDFSATAASIESGSFIAPVSGTYWFAVDQWESGGDYDWFVEVIVSAPVNVFDNGAGDQSSDSDYILVDPLTSMIPDGVLVLESFVFVNYAFEDSLMGYFYDTTTVTLDWQLPATFDSVSMTVDGTDFNRPALVEANHFSDASISFTVSDPNSDNFDFELVVESFVAHGSDQVFDLNYLLLGEYNLTSGSTITYQFDLSDLSTWFGFGNYYIVASVTDFGDGGSGEVSTYGFVLSIVQPPPPATSEPGTGNQSTTTTTSAAAGGETTTPTGGAAPGFELITLVAAFTLVAPVVIIKKRRK